MHTNTLTKQLLTITFLFLASAGLFAQDSLIFIVRVDDIQSRGTQTPKSILTFQNAVEQRGGKVSWAIMPHRLLETQNTDGVLMSELRQSVARGHEPVIHGWNHTCPTDGNTGHEMYCPTTGIHLSYQAQSKLLDSSLKLLRDSLTTDITTFIAPGHYDDSTTYQVVLDKGLKYIATNGPMKNYVYKNLFNLHWHNEYTWSMTSSTYQSSMTNALRDIRAAAKTDGYFCLLLHDPFIRQGYSNGIVIQWTGELLDSVRQQFSNKIKFMTIRSAAEYFKNQLTYIPDIKTEPENFELSQNYPNPFNPSTVIEFTVAQPSRVRVCVYDMLGREAALLLDEEKPAGKYAVNFSGDGLKSGVYFYKLQSGHSSVVRKMTLLK